MAAVREAAWPAKLLCSLAACVLGVVWAWGDGPPGQAQIVGLLSQPPPGWQKVDGPQVYSADNLWEWIDGDAPVYLEYQFSYAVRVLLASEELRVEVGVFVMQSPLDAFGLFSRQRSEQAPAAPIANSAFWDGAQLHIWRNFVYLRLLPARQEESWRPRVRELAAALCEGLQPAESLPRLLTLLPPNNLLANSPTFYRANVLGQEKLRNGVRAKYRLGEAVLTLWLLECPSKSAAAQSLQLLAGVLGKQRSLRALGEEAFAGSAASYGPTMAMREGSYVAAVTHAVPPDFAEALLRMISVRIRVAEAAEG
jgi:hypothetical protein